MAYSARAPKRITVPISAGLLLIVLVSIVIRRPFTLQYAREQVAREYSGRDPQSCAKGHLLRVRLTERAFCLSDCASDPCFRLSQCASETALYCSFGRSSLRAATHRGVEAGLGDDTGQTGRIVMIVTVPPARVVRGRYGRGTV
jgi:hypothetical protein